MLAKDMLFATLDPTSRALRLPCGKTVMLIDTVGLLRRLPHHLVQAFHSTLEQAAQADILLNVCDASSPEAKVHLEVTESLLAQLGCGDTPVISVLNKCDKAPEGLLGVSGPTVRISARTGEGIPELLAMVEANLPSPMREAEILLPFAQSGLAARIRREGSVEEEEYRPEGLYMKIFADDQLLGVLRPYLMESTASSRENGRD